MDYKENFSFTKQERRGILVFFIITISTTFILRYWPKESFTEDDFDPSLYYLPEDSVIENEFEKKYSYDDENNSFFFDGGETTRTKKPRQKFAFDPNVISKDSLMLLGFSAFGSKSLVNFRSKGGKIKDMEKFKTIFGIDTNLVNELETFISYEQGKTNFQPYSKSENTFKKKEVQIIEINTADSLEWEQLPGVGAYLTYKIMKNRKKLGGFLSVDQLTELNIIQDSVFQKISQFLTVDNTLITKININTADYKTFVTHPYFTKETANAILKYRKQHGDFQDVKHIRRIISIKEETGEKILPYLMVE
jgi:competence protein ComEA